MWWELAHTSTDLYAPSFAAPSGKSLLLAPEHVSPYGIITVMAEWYLREIHTESIHVQPIQEARETLAEPGQALVHQLQVHEVRFEVGHRVREFCEGRF